MGDFAYIDIEERLYNDIRARINGCLNDSERNDILEYYTKDQTVINYLLYDIEERIERLKAVIRYRKGF